MLFVFSTHVLTLTFSIQPSAFGQTTNPLSPQAALATFRLADEGLLIELVAAEPDVVSPVALAWDEEGRMFVAEMIDYPLGPLGGRIKWIQEGAPGSAPRRVSVFADKLPFPNGVLPWNRGVLVTAAPNLWYLRDSSGVGRADQRRVLLTGFGEGDQQLRVNGLTWGLDNWVYGANGRDEGAIRKPDDPPAHAVSIRHRDFRFQPGSGAAEAIAGFSQFGLARDDWGNRFPSWNTNPFRHVVLEERYLSRNPYLAAAGSVAEIADPSDPNRVFSISPPQPRFNTESVEFFNASCGNTIYRGDLLGRRYAGNAFVCEPLTNLVQRRTLAPRGPTFVARRAEQGREFLASTDPWFRPVNLATGPDGALYVVDFYREVIEHPDYIPANLRQGVDFRRGHDRGRIWRIRPKTAPPESSASRGRAPQAALRRAESAELVRALSSANGWWRDTAQRLLVERQDRRAIPALEALAGTAALPQARVQALWTLEGLHGLDDALLSRALRDPHPRVREQAVRLSEGRLAGPPGLTPAVVALANDPDVRVRFQAALTLGALSSSDGLQALARVADRDAADEWMRLAVLSGLGETAWPFLQVLLDQHPHWLRGPSAAEAHFLSQAAALVGARNREAELAACLSLLTQPEAGTAPHGQLAILEGLAEGLAHSARPLRSLMAQPPAALGPQLLGLRGLIHFARATVGSAHEQPERRVRALQVLILAEPALAAPILLDLLAPRNPPELQAAAARGLADVADPALATKALEPWSTYTTATRRDIVVALLRAPALARTLVQAIERNQVGRAELDPAARASLLRIPDAELRKRGETLLRTGDSGDRQAVLRKYQPALWRAGARRHGAELFAKNCVTCHQIQGQGHRVGPDLSGIAGRPKEMLLSDLLDPSKEVAPDYVDYTLVTTRGLILTGLIAEETAASVKLRRAEGAEDTVLRNEIEELRASGKSLMPEGLEQTLSIQDVADLLDFLQHPGPLPGPAANAR